ncbi:citrulline utilization hydrolase CtlX [Ottowia testudinis]|uniref:Amidinotransferase n=1 Tax=Ottowia testudinis TaxID=2816950 RepID=A0A975H4G5_9BURK|nr:arginine deiminase-related protein [Ottowia testudinis]QTD46863.1 amidinotransferase [Ottowia testudinis]
MTSAHRLRSIQAPPAVVMVRPHRFESNPETAQDNRFQSLPTGQPPSAIAQAAHAEVTAAAERLRQAGVTVHLFEDTGELNTPDSVFPNNWFSTHPGGHIAIYPMYNPSRRRERRADVIEMLKRDYRVQDVIDYSGLEPDGLFLEGTGAMVFDHLARVAYTARSNRADPLALERFATHFNFEPMVFDTRDSSGQPIYHTNVLMCIGTAFALVALDGFVDPARAAQVRTRLEESGRQVIPISMAQVAEFAGNAIELSAPGHRLLALSERAAASLTPAQKAVIDESAELLPLRVPTIELAGGSVRCMLAGIHLSPRGVGA